MKYRILGLLDRLTGCRIYSLCHWVWEYEILHFCGQHDDNGEPPIDPEEEAAFWAFYEREDRSA